MTIVFARPIMQYCFLRMDLDAWQLALAVAALEGKGEMHRQNSRRQPVLRLSGVATVDGLHEAGQVNDAPATDCEPSLSAGGMHCFVLSNLDTEFGCTVCIEPCTEDIHSHDGCGIPATGAP
jgi:hypothetical protein